MTEAIEQSVATALRNGVPRTRIANWLESLSNCLRDEAAGSDAGDAIAEPELAQR